MNRLLAASSVALLLGACNDQFGSSGKSLAPIPPRTMALMSEKGMAKSDPILVRLYKKESELEVWKKAADGKYAMLKTFPICRWSGQLGPKRREGDRQAPEGFYTITPGQLNPNSSYYLSFNTGYPNAYDKAHGGTGSELMVHGTCSSRGCYAMTDEGISEVYALAREAFSGGQRGFQFQAYPFRMTAENLAKYRYDPNMPFWKNLKEGSDNFEVTKAEPKVAVCAGRYAFNTVGTGCAPDPTLAPALAEKEETDRQQVAELVAKGTPAVKLVYADGGQHETFRPATMTGAGDGGANFAAYDAKPYRNLGDVSRPDALAEGPREIAIDQAGRPIGEARPSVTVAALKKAPGAAGSRLAAAEKATPAVAPSRIVVASADASDAIASGESKSLYDRMVGLLGPKGESKGEAAKAEAAPEAAVAEAAASTVPPRRPAASAKPGPTAGTKPLPVAPKPQASLGKEPRQHVATLARAKASAE